MEKKDWLGIEAIKKVREGGNDCGWGKVMSWALRKGDVIVMIILSINFDPFITTAYMRYGSNEFNGMSQIDWRIFLVV